jgi:nucleoside-diphosphate-sugar epimerase
MRVLVVGGSGYVGGMVLPHLAGKHELRVFDLRPPADPSYEYVVGGVDDLDALTQAATGMDSLLFMAMGLKNFAGAPGIISNFDVTVKGLYLALYGAHQAGITHAVFTSSMSIYEGDLMQRTFADEEISPDATGMYGLTKRLGEEVGRNATRTWGMSVNALRLCFPTQDDEWRSQTRHDVPTLATAASDVAGAMLAAFDYRAGFQAFTISGDYQQKIMNMSKAKRMLGWEPLQRPKTEDPRPEVDDG